MVDPAVATIVTAATPSVTDRQPDLRHRHASPARPLRPQRPPAPSRSPSSARTTHLRRSLDLHQHAQPLAGGPPPTATSGPLHPTATGTYRWIAAYSGDVNYPGDREPVQRRRRDVGGHPGSRHHRHPGDPDAPIGGPISDVATVTGGAAPGATPTGTVTLHPLRSRRRHLRRRRRSSPARPSRWPEGRRRRPTPGRSRPTAPGTYRWIAAYSGDANYPPVTSACNDANESSIINQSASGRYTPLTPARILDTRNGRGLTGSVGRRRPSTCRSPARAGSLRPASSAVAVNVTVTPPTPPAS